MCEVPYEFSLSRNAGQTPLTGCSEVKKLYFSSYLKCRNLKWSKDTYYFNSLAQNSNKNLVTILI